MSDLSPKNITRIKNVTHSEQSSGKTAYLKLEESEFVLHWPNRQYKNILDAQLDEMIIIYQTIDNDRYYTHLVQPIDSEIREDIIDPSFKFGRYVKLIAYTGIDGKIPLSSAPHIDLRNSYGFAKEITDKMMLTTDRATYQLAVWKLFEPFMHHELVDNHQDRDIFHNDELELDFESTEGRRLFRLHRSYERDNRISLRKKEEARKNGNLFCEVCNFSFVSQYGQDYIECHHLLPIHKGERLTKPDDLALVCSNCHRMLHRKIGDEYLSVDQLKNLIESSLSN